MEILLQKNYQTLLDYLPQIKASIADWLFIDVRLNENIGEGFSVDAAADLIRSLFKDKEGMLYVCNEREVFVLVRWGKSYVISEVTRTVERRLPGGSCKVLVQESTPDGLMKMGLLISYKKPAVLTYSDKRHLRRENVILVADDDMYMRTLVKKGLAAHATVHEMADGIGIVAAYEQHLPDILFLDIHMPNMDGTDVLRQILKLDPSAFVVMLSADSTKENVEWTAQHGAKGFMAKPFTKEKLLEYLKKCPTIS